MVAWDRRYNISGTLHCGNRFRVWCDVLKEVLQSEEVGYISHFTGAISVFASSRLAFVTSCGFEVHDFLVLAEDNRSDWLRLADSLELALVTAGLPYSLTVEDSVLVLA